MRRVESGAELLETRGEPPAGHLLLSNPLSRFSLVLLAISFSLLSTASGQDLRTQCSVHNKSRVEMIESSRSSYSIKMNGSIDGEMTRDPMGYWAYDQFWEPNVSVRMENLGDTPVVNPWLRKADAVDTRSLKSIVDSIVRPEMSDKEKARRLWEYEIRTRFHATTQDDEVADVVKRVNVYGYSLCYDASKGLSDLWRAAGLRVRQGFPNGHSLAEVFYEGDWHLLDSDESIISLLRDNETIASEPQVVADHDLMKRTHTYGPLANDSRLTDEGSAALLYYEGKREGEQPSLTRHSMDFTLRPNESITWAWNPANLYHAEPFSFADGDAENWNKRWRVIAHVMDGEMTYSPDLHKASSSAYLSLTGVEHRTAGPFGDGLYLTGSTGAVEVPVKSAYPVVGGRVEINFGRADLEAEDLTVALSFDRGKTWVDAWTSPPSDYGRMYVDLNPFFKKTDPARYEYILRMTLNSRAKDPAVALHGFYLRSTLQMAPLAMPGLALGTNDFIYSDDSPGSSKVRITHSWNECEAAVPIPSEPASLNPVDGGTYSGTKVKFSWQPGSGPQPNDYEFELSEFPDMRWVLSPNFHKLVSRTVNRGTSSYELTAVGLLNPDTKYYWRVRARSDDGVWGRWSKTSSFSLTAPALPVNVTASFDQEHRTVRLAWHRGSGGTQVSSFRVYGSEERGFSTNDQSYDFNNGLEGTGRGRANHLLDTANEIESTEIPEQLWRPYYRVVAIDKEGRISGASDIAELKHPLITSSKLPPAELHHFYEAHVETSASIGHLVSADENGKSYQLRYRTGDNLEFVLEGAPPGISIDGSGVISGLLKSGGKNRYQMLVTVKSKYTGASDSVQLPLVVQSQPR